MHSSGEYTAGRHEGRMLSTLEAVRGLLEANAEVAEVGSITEQGGTWAETVRLFVAPIAPIDMHNTADMNELMTRWAPSLVQPTRDRAFFNPTTRELTFAVAYFDEPLPENAPTSFDGTNRDRRIWVVLYPDRTLAAHAYEQQLQLNQDFIANGQRHRLQYVTPLLYNIDEKTAEHIRLLHPAEAPAAVQKHSRAAAAMAMFRRLMRP